MAETYGADVYGVGDYGHGLAHDGYGSGLYGAGGYGVAGGGGGNPFPAYARRPPKPKTLIHRTDDDEAAVALVLSLL